MSTLLGVDVETEGLEPSKHKITEIGLVLFDTVTLKPVRVAGFLVKTGREITPEITKLTGITTWMLEAFGVDEARAIRTFCSYASQADWLVAHNAQFDREFLLEACKRQAMDCPTLPWADTKTDLPAEAYTGRSSSLKYMACDHGFLYDAHRAVSDVLAMFKLVARYDVDIFLRRAATPNVTVRARVTFDTNQKAKERGYYWQPASKMWTKPIKENEVEAERQAADFEIEVLTA